MENQRKQDSPKVSVLMSVYNTQDYVRRAIESILDQTLVDLELIIIDDCSTDESWSIIQACAENHPRILPIRCESNGGASRALNLGLELASGTYLTRQDSDDVSLPNRLAEQVDLLEANEDLGAVGTAVQLIDVEDRPLRVISYPSQDIEIQQALLDRMCFCGPTVMAKRDSLMRAGFFFDERFSGSEDYDMCLRLSEVTAMANLEKPLYRYRQHGFSVSHRRRAQQMVRKAQALEQAIQRRYGSYPQPEHNSLIARDYLRAAVLAYASDQKEEAVDPLQRAMAFNPALLDMPAQVEDIVRRYTPHDSTERSLSFTRGVFSELLPTNRALSRVRRKLLAEIYAKEVFSVNADAARLRSNLWAGIRNEPRWLLNRGVLALIFRQLFRRSHYKRQSTG
jgi:glycosyltransferase involved in cell wall biosynthesis